MVDPAIIKAVQDADRIYILAAGTSYHAGFASPTAFARKARAAICAV
ncbi:glucosamine--fructose-6-phosphate aminotransferase [Streptococcus pneumoniae]|nr:glucosamine--fructose-6-phosphate aminotransferase [Streptococcus pneumoniae]